MTDTRDAPATTKERLLVATLETIDAVGMQRATTRLIAEGAEVNLQLIQYHFGGKDQMVAEAQRYIVDRFFDVVGPALLAHDDLAGALRAGVAATWRLAQEQPALVQPDLLLQARRAHTAAPGGQDDRATHGRLRGLLTEVMATSGQGLAVPLDVFVVLVTGGLSGLIEEHRVGVDADTVEAALDAFSELLLGLVVPD
ncbi:MAG: TetR/AcrR family transcriptional regulator [Anaerolineae bacterium]